MLGKRQREAWERIKWNGERLKEKKMDMRRKKRERKSAVNGEKGRGEGATAGH